MTRAIAHLVAVAAAAVLTGCGNAVEHLSMGNWRDVGKAQPPINSENGNFLVTTSVPGEAPVVCAGDLVKARVAFTTVDGFGSTKHNPQPQDVSGCGRVALLKRHHSSLWRRLHVWHPGQRTLEAL